MEEISDEKAWEIVLQYEGFIQKLANKTVTLSTVRDDYLQEFRCQAFVAIKRYYGRGSIFQILGFTKNRVGHKIEQDIVDVVRIPISRKQTKPQLVDSVRSIGYDATAEKFNLAADTLSLVINNYPVDKDRLETHNQLPKKQFGSSVDQDIYIYHQLPNEKELEDQLVKSEMEHYLMSYLMTDKNDILTHKEMYVIVRRYGLNPEPLLKLHPDVYGEGEIYDLESIDVEYEDISLSEVGRGLGVSRERIRQIEKGAIEKIREHLFFDELPDIKQAIQSKKK